MKGVWCVRIHTRVLRARVEEGEAALTLAPATAPLQRHAGAVQSTVRVGAATAT